MQKYCMRIHIDALFSCYFKTCDFYKNHFDEDMRWHTSNVLVCKFWVTFPWTPISNGKPLKAGSVVPVDFMFETSSHILETFKMSFLWSAPSLPVSFNNTCFTLIQIAEQGNDLDFDNIMKWYPLGQKEAISHTGLWRPWEEDNDHPNHKCGCFQSWSHDAFWAVMCSHENTPWQCLDSQKFSKRTP